MYYNKRLTRLAKRNPVRIVAMRTDGDSVGISTGCTFQEKPGYIELSSPDPGIAHPRVNSSVSP
jgi:hypothetical protein